MSAHSVSCAEGGAPWRFAKSSRSESGGDARSKTIKLSVVPHEAVPEISKGKVYIYVYINQKKNVPIGIVCVTCWNTSHFAHPCFNTAKEEQCKQHELRLIADRKIMI